MIHAETRLAVHVILERRRRCRFIEADTEPRGVLANAAPDFSGVLADARGEDQRVQPAEGGGQGSQFAADAVDKQSDRLAPPCGSSLASRVRMSSLMPETPKSPDSL